MKRTAALVIGASLIWLSGCEPQEAVSGSIQPPVSTIAQIELEHFTRGGQLVRDYPIIIFLREDGLSHASDTLSIGGSWSHTTDGNESARS